PLRVPNSIVFFVALDDGVADLDLARAIRGGGKASDVAAGRRALGHNHRTALLELPRRINLGVLRARLPARQRLVELFEGNHPPILSQPTQTREARAAASRARQCVNFLYLMRWGWSAAAPR